jgi:protein phosphatase
MSPSRLTVEAWPVTEAGPAEENKDTVLIYEPTDPSVARFSGSLYVVVDGMGASSGGQLASRYTAQRIMDYFFNDAEPDLGLRLREAVQAANADLFAYSQQQPELVKLGATLVAAGIRGEELHVASVGDSRAYLIRDGQIQQITKDHTLVQQLIDEEAISPDEANDHPRRDVVLRSLGAEETVRIDIFDLRMRPDDALVLCSDGLTRYLHADEIAMLVGSSSPRSAAEMLVRKALDRSGKDSVTVITALVRDGAPAIPADTPHRWDGQPASFDPNRTVLRLAPIRLPQAGPPPPG